MKKLSLRLSEKLEDHLEYLVEIGYGKNKIGVVRKAVTSVSNEEAVNAILRARKGPFLKGDLRELIKKF